MKTIDLQVEGMSCGSCVKHVTHALQPLPGVSGVEVDLQSGHVRVSGELAQGSAPLLMALTDAGYPQSWPQTRPFPLRPRSLKPRAATAAVRGLWLPMTATVFDSGSTGWARPRPHLCWQL